MSHSPCACHSEACVPPPQSYQLNLSYSGDGEAGRLALAARDISPGELVLTSLPYVLVFNPSEFTSGLYLAATATSARVESGSSEVANTTQKKKSKPLTTSDNASAPVSALDIAYTTAPTWCSGCLTPIAVGARLLNWAALRDTAMDISAEQDAIEEALAAADANTEMKTTEGDPDADEEGKQNAKQLLKKPTKSAKMRKDTAVELRERLRETAVAQRYAALYTHSQRAQTSDYQAALHDYKSWWSDASASGERPTVASAPPVTGSELCASSAVAVGCTGCGVMVYCSRACWQSTHQRQHVESGECVVLRRMYPRIMKEYFAMHGNSSSEKGRKKGSHGRAGTHHNAPASVVMPGFAEVLHWARASSEERSLEAQSMLMTALVMCRAVKEGRGDYWWQRHTASSTTAAATPQPTASATPTSAHAQRPNSQPSHPVDADGVAALAEVVTESATVPREVLALQETRQRLGLTGKVEVMDDDAAASASPMLSSPAPHAGSFLTGDTTGSDDADPGTQRGPRHTRVWASARAFYGKDPRPAPDACPTGFSETQQELVAPNYVDMASMITNLCVLSKDRRGVYSTYYRRFLKLFLPWLPVFSHVAETDAKCGAEEGACGPGACFGSSQPMPRLPFDLSAYTLPEDVFLRLCAAAQCNSFGVYSKDDRCVGFAIYPEASYFNHSCYPNACRVMQNGARAASFYALRPIRRGEPVTICYTDIQERSTAERRRNLLHTYRFFCQCERCAGCVPTSGGGAGSSEKEAIGDISLCMECPVRGYMRPIPPAELYPDPALARVCAPWPTSTAEEHNSRTKQAEHVEREATATELERLPVSWDLASVISRQCTVCQRICKND